MLNTIPIQHKTIFSSKLIRTQFNINCNRCNLIKLTDDCLLGHRDNAICHELAVGFTGNALGI